jgi:hypothetical protein
MKKYFAFLILGIILLGVGFAQTTQITEEVENFVKNIAKTKGIGEEKIEDIKEVNFKKLPKDLNLQNIDETNLALYEIQVTNDEKPIYIITASKTKIKETIEEFTQKMFLTFGYDGVIKKTTFLKNAVGVLGSNEKGYVMIRDGSITGISTNLEAIEGTGTVEIIIHKNGKEIGFRNSFIIEETKTYKDYDSISKKILNFEKGDLISIELKISGNLTLRDVTTLLEIETN